MTRRRFWWLLIGTVLIAAAAVWAYQYIEWVEKEVDLGPTEEARKEPFLAAKKYLEQLGIDVELRGHFRQLDSDQLEFSNNDVLILVDAYGSLSPKRASRLLDWVDRGGQLVTAASNPFVDNLASIKDPLFEQFNIAVEESDEKPFDPKAMAQVSSLGKKFGLEQFELCNMLNVQVEFNFADDNDAVQAHFLSENRLLVDDTEQRTGVFDDEGGFIVQYELGDGLISYMSYLDFWKNPTIGCFDHAYILWQLAATGGKVWFLYNRDAPGLVSLLWQYYHYLVSALLLLIMSWLWRRNNRFGPVRVTSTASPRRLMEHIEASARFNWKHHQGGYLVALLRDDIGRRMELQHPGFAKRPAEVQVAILVKQTQLGNDIVAQAMGSDISGSPEQFIDVVRWLKMIKEKL